MFDHELRLICASTVSCHTENILNPQSHTQTRILHHNGSRGSMPSPLNELNESSQLSQVYLQIVQNYLPKKQGGVTSIKRQDKNIPNICGQ